jgi:hypothetical protein
MNHHAAMPALDWVKRVNRSWVVRSDLNGHAESWLNYLAGLNDGRLQKSCEIARAMCSIRDRQIDPKPWFYAGLFSLATFEEAKLFIPTHRLTKSVVPAMRNDPDVLLWIDRVGPETDELVFRLRREVDRLISCNDSAI